MVDVNGIVVHYGDPTMREYPGTKRGDKFCTRSFGIKNKKGKLTRDNIYGGNFWSRLDLWSCKGKKSIKLGQKR